MNNQAEPPRGSAEEQHRRLWIVSLHAPSAVRLSDDKLLNILSSTESELQVAVRIRNQVSLSTDDPAGPRFFGALVVEAAGEFEDMATAVDVLTSIASPYFQIAAIAANAAVEDPQDLLVSSPPISATDTGRFLVQRAAHHRTPPPTLRELPVQAFMEMLGALNQHGREDRLHRAMAHYLLALSNMSPQNWILSAESLFISVESISRVILQRLLREADLPDDGEGKHRLAVARGFDPANERDRSHLGRLDSWIREQHVFAGDRECYRNLLEASDAFEHSSEGFDFVRSRANESAREAFRLIRRAILREIGVADDSPLFRDGFDYPLATWRPVLELEGTYSDSAPTPRPGFTPETFRDAWPDFLGPSVIPVISRIEDRPDGKRTLTLTVNTHLNTLAATQRLQIHESRWIMPDGSKNPVTPDSEVTNVTLNGEDVTEQWTTPANDGPTPADDLDDGAPQSPK